MGGDFIYREVKVSKSDEWEEVGYECFFSISPSFSFLFYV